MICDVSVVGRIGKVELRKWNTGEDSVIISVCVSNTKKVDGVFVSDDMWLECYCNSEQLIKKTTDLHSGDLIYLSGDMKMREWDNIKTGSKEKKVIVVVNKIKRLIKKKTEDNNDKEDIPF